MQVHFSGGLQPGVFRTASVSYGLLKRDRFLIIKLGAMNVMIPFTALAGIMTYAWPFAKTEASLIVVTVLYGFVFCCHPLKNYFIYIYI